MLLLYFMDGVKYDMMKEHMPFLASINSMPLKSEFGYSCACHATMYTSRYIEEHGTWFIWKRGNQSPYKWINYVPGLKYLNFLPVKMLLGKITRFFANNTSYSGVPCLVNLPLKYWPLFELCENVMWNDSKWKSNFANMFSIMEDSGVTYNVVALHNKTKREDAFKEEKFVNYKQGEFIYYFLGYTDNMMHAYGENSFESQEYLRQVDDFIQTTYEKAKRERPNEEIIVIAYSDHGHIDLERPYIDINHWFKREKLNVNKYVHLIESNYARFWFRNEKEKQEVYRVIEQMQVEGMGFVLNEEWRQKYHLSLDSKEHGELIFYLDAPREFTKTIWGYGHSVKSGHGFLPDLPKHQGIFCSNKPLAKDREFAYLTDILPTVMSQLNINRNDYLLRGDNIVNVNKAE